MKDQALRTVARDQQNQGVRITWVDGSTASLSAELLRRECPCAECRERRGDERHGKPLTGKAEPEGVSGRRRSPLLRVVENTRSESLRLEKIWGVGQYAVGFEWGDGHSTGIYTFSYLSELAHRHLQSGLPPEGKSP